MINQRIAELLSMAEQPERFFPATDLYNEGWMLRLVIDWFSRNSQVDCDIRFLEGSRWYSEALLPSQFLARHRGDKLAESWTHADGAIGHFDIGKSADGDLTLKEGATQLVVTEAKMFSKLSSGVTNASYFDQAARNVACIAEICNRATCRLFRASRFSYWSCRTIRKHRFRITYLSFGTTQPFRRELYRRPIPRISE